MNQEAANRMMQARTSLVLGNPFFGSLVLRLKLKEDTTCDTAWVDGQTLGYSPKFINSLKGAEIKALLAHEVWHCAAGHPWRRDAREHKQWNKACDLAINGRLKACGFNLPECGLFPTPEQDGKSAEWIFARLLKPQEQEGGQSKPDPLGEVRDSPSEGEGEEAGQDLNTEETWKQAVIQAEVQAKMQGAMPGAMARACEAVKHSRVDWKAALRRFITELSKADYSWQRPNRRYLPTGLYMPSLRSESCGGIALGVDTSGSIDGVALASMKAEIEAIMQDVNPAFVDVYYADASVCGHDRFSQGEPLTWRPKGGGGTSFSPVFAAIAKGEELPVCCIYLTDMYGDFPANSPVPTLWVTSTQHITPPFGEVVLCED